MSDVDPDADEIGWLMATLDVTFIEAVEILCVQRHSLEWLQQQQKRGEDGP